MLGLCQKVTLCYMQACVMENYFELNSATEYLPKQTEVGLEYWVRSVFIYGTIAKYANISSACMKYVLC